MITMNKSFPEGLKATSHKGRIREVTVDLAVPLGAAIRTLFLSCSFKAWYISLWKGGTSLFSAVGNIVLPKRPILFFNFFNAFC